MPRPQERRRLPRGPQLGVHFTLHALRWVYAYVAILALLVVFPALWAWWGTEGGTPEAEAAVAELGQLARLIIAPFALIAVVVSIHVGLVVGRVSRFVNDLDGPFGALRDRVARQTRLARRQAAAARRLTDFIDDDPSHGRELSALAHRVRDLADEQVRRPNTRSLDLRGGERTPAPEAEVASSLT